MPSPTQPRPRVGLKKVALVLLVLLTAGPLAFGWMSDAPGGTLSCSRAENRCSIVRGWLLRESEKFPTDDLVGAEVIASWERTLYSKHKVYGVDVVTRSASRELAGANTNRAEQVAIVATIRAFVGDPRAPSLEVHQNANTIGYVSVGLLVGIYGLFGLAMLIGRLRKTAASSGVLRRGE